MCPILPTILFKLQGAVDRKAVIHADANAEDCHVATVLIQNDPRSNITAAELKRRGRALASFIIIGSQFQS